MKTTSARGEKVDFDLNKIKESIGNVPENSDTLRRNNYVKVRRRRKLNERSPAELEAKQNKNQAMMAARIKEMSEKKGESETETQTSSVTTNNSEESPTPSPTPTPTKTPGVSPEKRKIAKK